MDILRKYKRPKKNPNVGGKDYWNGWCDAAVRLGFDIAPKYGSAKASWNNAKRRHTNRNFPKADVPIFYDVPGVPAGHVAVRLADGKVETTGLNDTFTVFDSIEAFERRWASLKWLGWTEDFKGVDIIKNYNAADNKTVDELFNEVMAGLHGDGAERKKSLGSRYAEVQAAVNKFYVEAGEIVYTVKKGDNLTKIANAHKKTWQEIYQKNRKTIGNNPNKIFAGQKLKI